MIGRVVGRQPWMRVPLSLQEHSDIEIEFVIDTAFDGFLVLPRRAVDALGLPFAYQL